MVDASSVRQAARELIRELGFLDARCAPAGVSHAECHTLVELDRRGPLTNSEIAEALRLDKSRVSRIVAALEERRFIAVTASGEDARSRVVTLTSSGAKRVALIHQSANARVEAALSYLSSSERAAVESGMVVYAGALGRARRAAAYDVRAIRRSDRASVARLIRTVMPEIGACGPGFALSDPEVADMPSAYGAPRSEYFVVTRNEPRGKGPAVLGGGGIGPLAGGDKTTCELRKMYFLPEIRGLGLGKRVLEQCLEAARAHGFKRCYLETMPSLKAARKLYEQNGFTRIPASLGNTGHFGCTVYYARPL